MLFRSNAEASQPTTLPASQAGARGFDTREVEPDDYYTSGSRPRSEMPRQPSSRKSYLGTGNDGGHMHKSRSESEFEDLAYDMPDPDTYRIPPAGSTQRNSGGEKGGAGWSNWIWGSYGEKDSVIDPRKDR